jgi:hypothetical protein
MPMGSFPPRAYAGQARGYLYGFTLDTREPAPAQPPRTRLKGGDLCENCQFF